jgi:tight adherence protein B
MSGVGLIAFIGAASTLGLLLLASTSARGINGRLRKRSLRLGRGGAAGSAARALGKRGLPTLRRDETRSVPFVEDLARRFLPRQTALRERLGRTGYGISIGVYVLICLGLILAGFAALRIGFRLPDPIAAPVAIAFGLGAPHFAVAFLIRRYRSRFLAVLPDAVDLVVRGLRAGLPVAESISTVAREMSQPIAGEFRRVTDSVRFGRSLQDVLWETARRLDIPEFNFFVISLSIQRETGGNLAETLTNLSEILRRRRQIRLKIRALSSEAKAGAYILGALPFLMFGLVYAVNPGYASMLLTDPRGMVLLGSGLASIGIAALIMFKMIRFEI